MKGSISFWDNGVTCFCHEAVGRLILQHFPDAEIDRADLALQKFEAISNERLKASAWAEYLRNGPRYRFKTPCGIAGVFSRYEVAFDEPQSASVRSQIDLFLADLQPTAIKVDRDA